MKQINSTEIGAGSCGNKRRSSDLIVEVQGIHVKNDDAPSWGRGYNRGREARWVLVADALGPMVRHEGGTG